MITRTRLIIAFMALCWINPAQADTSSFTRLPISLEGDRVTINVEWNGHPLEATLDSAATYPLISSAILSQINGQSLDETVDIFGVGGLRTFPVAQTYDLRVGKQRYSDVVTAVSSGPQDQVFKAILPISLLQGRTLDFQFSKKRLDIYNAAPRLRGEAVRSRFEYEIIKGVPFIEVEVNGVKGLALVDTGSDITYINRAFARQAKAQFLPERTLEIFGTGPDNSPVQVSRIKKFELGDHRKESFELLTANTTVFDYLERRDEPTMVLGMDTLGQLHLQIDREKQELFLSRREDYAEGRRYNVTPFSGRLKKRR
ncbi:MAG: pepsin/retropepsin-like aspartic protease family protein [Pseudomonadota bacterium]